MHTLTALAGALLLAGCGGGGGSSGSTSGGGTAPGGGTPTAIQVTATNAAAVGASALDAAQNTQATDGPVGLVTAAEVAAPAPLPDPAVLLAVVRAVVPTRAPALASGATVSASQPCAGGGTVRVSGSVTLDDGSLRPGDSLALQASACRLTIDGVPTTLDGSLSFAVRSGLVPASGSSYTATLALVASNFTVADAARTGRLDGDLTVAVSQAAVGTATLTATGSTLAIGVATATASRTLTWLDYRRTVSLAPGSVQATLDATVQTDSTRLGSSTGARYTVATPTALRWSPGNTVPATGVLLVTGANGSNARYTFASGGVVTIAVDADGNGTAETTSTSSVDALRALL